MTKITLVMFSINWIALGLLTLMGAAFVAALIVALSLWFVREKRPAAPPRPAFTPTPPKNCPQCGARLEPGVSEGLCPACLLQRGIATESGPPGQPPFTPPPLADLAKLFPQLEILELINQGGMGAVYKARQPALERLVALKVLAPRSAADMDFAGRFTREARALAKLSHPNIVAVYDFGQANGLNYFIMEYVDGANLRQVQHAGRLTPQEALKIVPQICAALQFAHDEGIVHRDIKPENVLLDKKGRVKITDFGLAKIVGQEKDFRLTTIRDVMGTPHYMAPEQVEKPMEVDHRADIYSLGVVFYEMLTGELPLGKFAAPSAKVQIDVRLDDVVLRTLEKEPLRRYQQVSELKTAVETIATTPLSLRDPATQHSGAPAPGADAASRRRSRITGLSIAALALLLLLTGVVIGIRHVQRSPGESLGPADLAPYTAVNLADFYNGNLDTCWVPGFDPGAQLASIPHGRHLFLGVPFDVSGVVQLQGQRWQKKNLPFPERVEGIPVRNTFRKIHMLHANSAHEEQAGTPVASLVLHYADGQTERLTIRHGEHTLDWWMWETATPTDPQSAIAWVGSNPATRDRDLKGIRIVETTFLNPRPDAEVETIDFVSAMAESAPFIIALTVER